MRMHKQYKYLNMCLGSRSRSQVICGKHIIIVLLMFAPLCSYAQYLQIMVQQPLSQQFTAVDTWNMTVQNPGQAISVYFENELTTPAGEQLSVATSAIMIIKPGVYKLNGQLIQTADVHYSSSEVRQSVAATGKYPAGNYTWCIRAFDSDTRKEITSTCIPIQVINVASDSSQTRSGNKWKNIDVYGHASVELQVSDQPGYTQALPSDYARIDLDPSLTIYQVPITSHVHLTTEASPEYPNLNTYNVSFDKARFRQQVQSILMQKAIELSKRSGLQKASVLQQLQELENLQLVLQDPALQLELMAKDSLQTMIARVQQDTTLGIAEKEEQLLELQNKYNAILAKKRQVEQLQQRVDELLALKEKWENSGLLKELKETDYQLPDLNDPDVLTDQLKQYGMYVGVNKVLSNVEQLSVGSMYPVYTPLLLNGIMINGGHLDLHPGKLILSVNAGKTSSIGFIDSLPLRQNFDQTAVAARMGFGKTNSTHVIFSGIRFTDLNGISNSEDSLVSFPSRSTLGGLDMQIGNAYTGGLEFRAEINGLLFNHNTNDTALLVPELNEYPIPEALEPTWSSSVDFAYAASLIGNIKRTRTSLFLNTRFVGPGYTNPGTPGLQTDIMKNEARLEQKLFSGKMLIDVSAIQQRDNFSAGKGVTTSGMGWGSEIVLQLRKLPRIQVTCNSMLQTNDAFTNESFFCNGIMSHQYQLFGLHAHAMANYLFFKTTGATPETPYVYTTNSVMLNHLLTYNNGMSIGANAQLSFGADSLSVVPSEIFGITFQGELFHMLQTGINLSYAGSENTSERFGGGLTCQYQISKYINVYAEGYLNQYSYTLPGQPDLSDAYARLGAQFTW